MEQQAAEGSLRLRGAEQPVAVGLSGEGHRSGVAERGVRPLGIVIVDPVGDERARVAEREKLVAHAAVEALDEADRGGK